MELIFKLLRHFFELVYWEHKSIAVVRDMQLQKFKKIFEYAREHSAFYRNIYTEAGVMDLDIQSWDDVEKVPIINKQMLRDAKTEDLITCDFNSQEHNLHTTSGSTGSPFKIIYDKWVDYSGHVRLTWMLMKHGYLPTKKLTMLSRYTEKTKFEVEEDLGVIKRLQKHLHLFERDIISIFEEPSITVDLLKKQNPYVLWSSPSATLLVAQELERRGERLRIPILVLMAETCTEEQASLFKERICLNYIDNFGTMEFPSMGYSYNQLTCKKMFSNFVFAEVQNDREADGRKIGDLVLTNLINYTMPFIRYNIGDYVGVLDTPDYPIKEIGTIYGRFDDILHVNGIYIYSHCIYQMYMDFLLVDQYKIFQHKDGTMEIQLKLKSIIQKQDAIIEAQRRWYSEYPTIPIKVVVKDDLPIDPKTRKFKVIEKEK